MEKFRYYNVAFTGLTLGQHDFEFEITQSFFDLFEFDQDFRNPKINLQLTLDKKNNFLELFFTLKGTVELDCDLSGETFTQEIQNKATIIVKFSEEHDYSDDEIWVIPHGEHAVNIAQMIYEMTLLAIPIKRIHPGVESGEIKSEVLDLLDKYSLVEESEETDEQEEINEEDIDPRWEQLKKLKNNN